MFRQQQQASSGQSAGSAEGSGHEVRILLIGKSGNGKSTLGNTILGASSFKTGRDIAATTQQTQQAAADRFGQHIQVIDTPDICNLDKDQDYMKKEVGSWKTPKPTAVLLTVRCDCRYTPEEYEVYETIRMLWHRKLRKGSSLQKRLVVAFTFHDRQDLDLDDEMKTAPKELRSVLKEASYRYVEFNNNEDIHPETKEGQVEKLMRVIHGMEKEREQKRCGYRYSCTLLHPPAWSWCDNLRIVLLGKTGVGKSSLGNTILGMKVFGVGRGMSSETRLCSWKDGVVGDTRVEVTDTPGLCDTHLAESDIFPEVGKSVAYAAPGPHVLLVVLRADTRFTAEEFKAYLAIKQIFGQGICNRIIVVFNGLDKLDEQKEYLDDQVRRMGGNLKTLLGEANYRYFGMINKASNVENDRQLAQELLGFILRLVRERGGPDKYFTSPLVNKINGFKQAWLHHYITKNRCTPQQAEKFFKQNIEHDRGLLQTMGNAVSSFFRSAGAKIKDVCAVM